MTKVAGTKINNIETDLDGFKKSDLTGYAKKTEVANDITTIRNYYATNASVDSKINDLKAKHISDKVKKVEDKINKNEGGISVFTGFFSYTYQSDLVYECKLNSFKIYAPSNILDWKPTNIYSFSNKNELASIQNINNFYPNIKNITGELYVFFNGNYFVQDIITIPTNVINIYCVYKLDPIDFSRYNEFTIQNALFGAIEITKNANTSKYKYKGYGICFDESEEFTHARKEGNFNHTTTARNVIIFGVDMSFSKHANNKANNIYVMGKDYIQKINDTTIYVEKMFYRNLTDPGHKFVLSLHYNGDNSYLFVNRKQELKFKTKTLLYGNIYDFVVDYKPIVGVHPIYDMHKYLMTKHNISS